MISTRNFLEIYLVKRKDKNNSQIKIFTKNQNYKYYSKSVDTSFKNRTNINDFYPQQKDNNCRLNL